MPTNYGIWLNERPDESRFVKAKRKALRDLLEQLLTQQYSVQEMAIVLGLNRTSLYKALKAFDLMGLIQIGGKSPTPVEPGNLYQETARRAGHDFLFDMMTQAKGNVVQAARLANMNRTDFYKALDRHGVIEKFRSDMPRVKMDVPENWLGRRVVLNKKLLKKRLKVRHVKFRNTLEGVRRTPRDYGEVAYYRVACRVPT